MDLEALVAVLRLSSPALPVGGYSYSQGLEAAIDSGLAETPPDVERWIGDHLRHCLARAEAPYFWRLARAWRSDDFGEASRWNDEVLASRASAELRAEAIQMGASLTRLLAGLEPETASTLLRLESPSYLAAYAFVSTRWGIAPRAALAAWCFAWLETQVLAWLKTGHAGHAAGQAVVARLSREIPSLVDQSEGYTDDEIHTFAPGLALASLAHERQDGRLFRS